MSLKVFLHTLLCAALFYTAWCRIVHTTRHTRDPIRWAFSLLAVAAIFLGIAPWAHKLWPWAARLQITWSELLILAAFLGVQVTTSTYWRRGVPRDFLKDAHDAQ
jgi:hypothetical protein